MASLRFCTLIFGLCLWVSLISPAHSLNCTSHKFTAPKKVFANCSDLPTLDAFLHYTYNASNSSLSVAFTAAPSKPDGWVAWAINPTGSGMVGAQSLIAFKSNGSMVVKTYNISAYNSILESKLSFDVWDLGTESAAGKMTIFATVKVPENADKLNQVWQVGPSAADGRPAKHDFGPANLNSKGPLVLVAEEQSSTPTAAPEAPGPLPGSGGVSRIRLNGWGLFLIFGSLWAFF